MDFNMSVARSSLKSSHNSIAAVAFTSQSHNDAHCQQRRVVTTLEHEQRPAIAILGRNLANNPTDLTHSRYGDPKIADRIAGDLRRC
jgi:hypothetical protein